MAVGAKYLGGSELGVLYTDRRTFDIDRNIVKELYPTVAPFTTFLTKLSYKPTNDPDYKIFEHRSQWVDQEFYVGEIGTWTYFGKNVWGIDGLKVQKTVDGNNDVGYLIPGLVLEFRSSTNTLKGRAIITAVNSQQSIDVKSILKGATAGNAGLSDLVSGDKVYVLTNYFEEGSASPEATSDELTVVWNSCGIMKTSVEVTGTLLETALRGYSNELARLRKEKAMEHKMHKNRAFLFSDRNSAAISINGISAAGLGSPDYLTGSNNRPLRSTMGAVTALERYGNADNKFTITKASASFDEINAALEKTYARVNERGVKYGFAAPDVITWFTNTGSGSFLGNSGTSLQVMNGTSRFGFPVKLIETGHGDLVLTKDIAFRGAYTGHMLVVDPKNIGIRVFRNPMYKTAVQANDVDMVKDMYISDEGLDISLLETHALFKFA